MEYVIAAFLIGCFVLLFLIRIDLEELKSSIEEYVKRGS
jgi:hypothetical protein